MILLASSFGGHWVQMKLVKSCIDDTEFFLVSTERKLHSGADEYLEDFNIRDIWLGLSQLPKALRIVSASNPDIIISTGAAPGLLILLAGFLKRKKTIWIDSIANSQRLSLSGRAARLFATRVLTQWPALASGRVQYVGSLL